MLHPHNAQEDAERLRSLAGLTDNFAHIIWMHGERKEYAHLVDNARGADRVWIVYECLNDVFKKLLVEFHGGVSGLRDIGNDARSRENLRCWCLLCSCGLRYRSLDLGSNFYSCRCLRFSGD